MYALFVWELLQSLLMLVSEAYGGGYGGAGKPVLGEYASETTVPGDSMGVPYFWRWSMGSVEEDWEGGGIGPSAEAKLGLLELNASKAGAANDRASKVVWYCAWLYGADDGTAA